MSTACSINDVFPNELLQLILCAVDSESLCLTTPHVCKLWRELYKNMPPRVIRLSFLWTNKQFVPASALSWIGSLHPAADILKDGLSRLHWFNMSDATLLTLTTSFPMLSCVYCLSDYALLTDKGISKAIRHLSLREVSFRGCAIGSETLKCVCGPELYRFESPWITTISEDSVIEMVKASPMLKILNLRGCEQLAVLRIANSVPRNLIFLL